MGHLEVTSETLDSLQENPASPFPLAVPTLRLCCTPTRRPLGTRVLSLLPSTLRRVSMVFRGFMVTDDGDGTLIPQLPWKHCQVGIAENMRGTGSAPTHGIRGCGGSALSSFPKQLSPWECVKEEDVELETMRQEPRLGCEIRRAGRELLFPATQ